jgi:spore germination protein GerM
MAKKKTSLGCLFWLALVLLVVVVFLFNQKNIGSIIEKTGFLDVLGSNDGPPEITINSDPSGPPDHPDGSSERREGESEKKTVDGTNGESNPNPRVEDTSESEQVIIEVKSSARGEDPEEREETADRAEPAKTRRARIYYVSVDPAGDIRLKAVFRDVVFRDSPLKQTLISLMKGPSTAEVNQGLLNIIPDGTKLLGVSVRNGTAIINFSEDFRFNPIGQAGLKAQLQQIVYTATEFPNVESVQFLIDGEVQEYLNSEGLYIRDPLSRRSF